MLVWLPTTTPPPSVQAATYCTNWKSTRVPPSTIRVLRTSGPHRRSVQTVSFKSYVKIVLAAEWPPAYPTEALNAGAIAIKQYAWYYAMNWRGGTARGGCYDLVDTTNDQVYEPETKTPYSSHILATEATWSRSLTREGRFTLTGYQMGKYVSCGADADGHHMFQRSARECAWLGKTADEILHIYYYPAVVTWDAPPKPAAAFLSPPAQRQTTSDGTATAAWTEEPAADTTITARSLSLVMAAPALGKCSVDRWMPAVPAYEATDPSPQSVTGLQAGFCYRFILTLTDSAGATTVTESGPILVDPLAPGISFTNPKAGTLTETAGTAAIVRWTEAPVGGTTIVARTMATEYGAQPLVGTCAGAYWQTLTSTSARSPVSLSDLTPLYCYRFRVTLTDSAGHKTTFVSGALLITAP
jgi:hypothetical protein